MLNRLLREWELEEGTRATDEGQRKNRGRGMGEESAGRERKKTCKKINRQIRKPKGKKDEKKESTETM